MNYLRQGKRLQEGGGGGGGVTKDDNVIESSFSLELKANQMFLS